MSPSVLRRLAISTALIAVAVSCGFRREKNVPNERAQSVFIDSQGRITIPEGKAPGYESVRAIVFQNRCLNCHGRAGGVNLETFASARAFISEIRQTVVVELSMPPRGSLSVGEVQLVEAWIKAGAPEQDQDTNIELAATPPPTWINQGARR